MFEVTDASSLDPKALSTSESLSLQIASTKLNGTNYLEWSQSAMLTIKGRGKLEYLTDPPPKPTDPNFKTWDVENSMIMSWLLHSIQPEIGKTYMFLKTAKDIWEATAQTYSNVGMKAHIYELKTKIHNTKQGSFSVTEYYNTIKSLWLELDHYQRIEMVVCITDTAKLH